MHDKKCKNSRRYIIQDDTGAFGKSLQLPYRGRLENIEDSKKYKTRQKSFPRQGYSYQCDELSRNLVDHHKLRVLHGGRTGNAAGGRNTDQDN